MRVFPFFTCETQSASLSLGSDEPRHGGYQLLFRDTLSSMASTGRDFGVMFFALVSAAFSKLFSAFWKKVEPTTSPSSSRRDYNLEDPEQLLKAWKKNPHLVMKKLLTLLDKNLPLAKKILMNLAKDWKNHPERYAQYDNRKVQGWKSGGEGRTIRMNMVVALNMFWRQLILNSDQLQLEGQICRGKITAEESYSMSPAMRKREVHKRLTPRQKRFRTSYDDLEKAKDKCQELWDYVYASLQQDERNLSDLHLGSMEEHLESSGEMDFGHTMERMLFFRNIHSLRADGALENANRLLLGIFDYLMGCKKKNERKPLLYEYHKINELVELASPLLQDPEKAAQIHAIILKMVDEIKPISKSPPRRSPTRRSPPSGGSGRRL